MMEEGLLSLKWNSHKIKFFERLKILKEKSNYTDATLVVEGKFYPVHKLVMSNCSEYFRDIFESTPCKSPVIVLKDVRSHDIEALLDYMYFGEVNVNQYDLASLLKTAECLQIEGLNSPNIKSTNLCKTSTSNQDDTQENHPPVKRRRFDSSTISPHAISSGLSPQASTSALVNPAQSPLPSSAPLSAPYPMKVQEASSPFPQKLNNVLDNADQTRIPLHTTPNIEKDDSAGVNFQANVSEEFHLKQDEPPIMKIELDDEEKQCKRIQSDNSYERATSSEHDPLGDCMFYKLEDEVDNKSPFHTASSSIQPASYGEQPIEASQFPFSIQAQGVFNEQLPANDEPVEQNLFQHRQVAAEWYRNNPRFWDKTLIEFKEKRKNEKMMDEFAQTFGKTGKWLEKWFGSQRTTLGKLKHGNFDQEGRVPTRNQVWVRRNFDFLWELIVPKPLTQKKSSKKSPQVPQDHLIHMIRSLIREESSNPYQTQM